MKRMNIKIFCLTLCTSLMMSGCTPSGGDESDVTAENNAETSAENVTETAETSVPVSGTETKKAESGTTAVSGTEVSENVSGTAKISDTAKVRKRQRHRRLPEYRDLLRKQENRRSYRMKAANRIPMPIRVNTVMPTTNSVRWHAVTTAHAPITVRNLSRWKAKLTER